MIHYYFLSFSLASPLLRSFLDSKAHAFFCKLDKAFFNRLGHFMRHLMAARFPYRRFEVMLTVEKREDLQQYTLGGRSSEAALYSKAGSCDRVTKCITSTRCIDRQKLAILHARQSNPLGWLRPLCISFCFRESRCSSLAHERGRASRDQSESLP